MGLPTPLYEIMDGLNCMVKAGKVRQIGISNRNLQAAGGRQLRQTEIRHHRAAGWRIIRRVAELADQHDVTMTEISLAWLLTKVTAPVVGATKLHHIEGAAKAVELAYLEEPYVPYALVGVMAQNTVSATKESHVWSTGNQKI